MLGNRIFFGWWVLLGTFLFYAAIVGILVYTLPLLYPELIREFGWNSEQVTGPATLYFLTGAIIMPFFSPLFDRYSVRLIMCFGVMALVGGLIAFASIQTVTHLTLIFLVFALGQVAAGLVPNMVLLTRWFVRHRGIAVGITLLGASVGGAVFPLIVKQVLANGDWQDAVLVLAVIGGIIMVVPLLFFIRSHPAEMGLEPDGGAGAIDIKTQPSWKEGPTLREALRMPAFYLLAFATGALWFCVNGILQHQTIFMSTETGLDMGSLPLVISLFFWSAVVGKLLFGWLSDRFDKTLVMFMSVINLMCGLVILRLSNADNMLTFYLYAAVFGIGFSGAFTMIQLVIAEFFAGRSYGKILGIFTMVDVGSGGIGIKAIAMMQVSFGSYLPVFEVLIGLCCTVAIIVFMLYRIRQNTSRQSELAFSSSTT